MNYGVMHAYFVDQKSGQFKAPFNTIYNEARVFTPKDTAIVTPNSDTPYSFVGLDLRAEPIVLCVPKVEKESLLRCSARRHVYLQLRLHRQPRDRQRCRLLHGRRARLERRDAQQTSRRYFVPRRSSASSVTAPSCSGPRTCPTL